MGVVSLALVKYRNSEYSHVTRFDTGWGQFFKKNPHHIRYQRKGFLDVGQYVTFQAVETAEQNLGRTYQPEI